jgi:hypothetical protein
MAQSGGSSRQIVAPIVESTVASSTFSAVAAGTRDNADDEFLA